MLWVHILEATKDGKTVLIPIYCDVYKFDDQNESEFLVHNIRATLKEHSGDIGTLNAKIAQWANENNVVVEGIPSASQYFLPDTDTYIAQLRARIEEISTLLQAQKDEIDAMRKAAEEVPEEVDEEHCKVHVRLEEMEELIQCAKANGCQHIDAAIAELRSGGSHGH